MPNDITLLVFRERIIQLSVEFERFSQNSMSVGKARVQFYRFAKLCDRFRIPTRQNISISEVRVDNAGNRVQLNRPLQLYDGLIVIPQGEQNTVCQPIAR